MNRCLLNRLAVIPLLMLCACGEPEPKISDAKPGVRLLTAAQYRNIIADVFGSHIVVGEAPDPILREDALLANSAGRATVSPSGLEKYERLAATIADQVVSESNRRLLIPCGPLDRRVSDLACADTFLGNAGHMLFRRRLTNAELERAAGIANAAGAKLGDFYGGLAYGLTSLLVSPRFLFIVDHVRAAKSPDGAVELTGEAKAVRLSFLLWNTTPDQTLLAAAEAGDLDTAAGLKRQVDRLMDSPRLENGVRAIFADMLAFEKFDKLAKDTEIYPAFDPEVGQDAEEQLLRTITSVLLDHDGDYRTLFTTRTTFMSAALGRIYRVPVPDLSGWSPYVFPPNDPHAGIQTLAGFVAAYSHPGRSSPTIRGRAIRELLLCQKVPDPPGDIDFTLFNQPSAAALPARERLAVHSTNPSCAGCHKIVDPIGLALENFDGAGQYRTTEMGAKLDVSGSLDDHRFNDTAEFAAALHDNPSLPSCLVQRVTSYALAGSMPSAPAPWVNFLTGVFAREGYRLKPLLKALLTSPNFYAVQAPAEGVQTSMPSAAKDSPS